MPTLDLDDVTIAYDIAGDPDAPPVVLMAGCGGPAAGWFAIGPALTAAGFRVVTFDHRGMAPSSSPPAPYSVADLVADAVGLVHHLCLRARRVARYSHGGMGA